MRTLILGLVGIVFVAGGASHAEAQGSSGRWYFNASVGGQGQHTFAMTSAFDIYGEKGTVAAAQIFGGGELFDVSGGARVWKNLALGLSYSAIRTENDASIGVRVPHPLLFRQAREASATVSGIEHTENAVHVHAVWLVPIASNVQLALMGGPSFFTVRQEFVTVRGPQDLTDQAPFTAVTITSVTATPVKATPVGINAGIDLTYFVTRMIGIGGFGRYASATVDVPATVVATVADKVRAGGVQTGGGLRLRF